ncbi:helix-turn-helix domain-containing protein [Nocardia sp. NBC_00565]|uniref:helix-turn-helix domain-containing protein n=1 Tax=Nocardia sp. NBC_00565 TaxID=2975993 RepID=UPI002E8037D7|nr:helix-turn-helix transcriptional regulator [Nocardia sp. NBC_00565]WUC01439.1 helix-turn-helix domain-containing protein [Nocardia sp. NBC_00565]
MTSSIDQQREALGENLRALRLNAALSGAELARRNGWHQTKISKIEYGRIKPSHDDIRAWCEHSNGAEPEAVPVSLPFQLQACAVREVDRVPGSPA